MALNPHKCSNYIFHTESFLKVVSHIHYIHMYYRYIRQVIPVM